MNVAIRGRHNGQAGIRTDICGAIKGMNYDAFGTTDTLLGPLYNPSEFKPEKGGIKK